MDMDRLRKAMINMDTDSKRLCQVTGMVELIEQGKEQEIETFPKEGFNPLLLRHSGKATK